LNTEATGGAAGRSAGPAAPLGLLEVLERDGRVRRWVPVHDGTLSIGRALDNDVVLDDPHVAAHHALIEVAAGTAPRLRVLPSLNPVQVGTRRLVAGEQASLGAEAAAKGHFAVGATRLRLRLRDEVLAPERPLARAPRHAVTLVLLALFWGWLLAGHAIELDPGSKAADWLVHVLGVPAALALWCLVWALASKLFQHRFDFGSHLAVAARGLVAIEAVDFVLPWAAALSGWVWPARIAAGATLACAAWTLFAHARLLMPNQRRALALVATTAFVSGTALVMALNQQRQERWFSDLYVAELPPPALLWVRPASRQAFVDGADALRARLQAQVRDAEREARAGEAADDE
jgi:hypothetical protein